MTTFDLLSTVQPTGGWYAVVGIKGDKVRQYLVETREELDSEAQRFLEAGWNVFFGVAKFKNDSGRTKSNVLALRSFWLDIDCGPTKAEINEKTQRPQGYIDQATGLSALRAFCAHVGLPKPVIVNSGRGLHVYWPLTEDITPFQWETTAARLRELCNLHSLYVDPAVFETARILRIPGTLNFKDDPATPVSVLVEGKPVAFEEFTNILGVKAPADTPAPRRGMTALGKIMQESATKSFAKIMRRSAKHDGCAQLLDCYQNRDNLSEARWFDALSVAKFCSDKDKAIHMLSEGHPDYDPAKTEQKIDHIQGPHNCATFERNNPGLCAQCPHFGKIKNPIVLGMEVKAAAAGAYAEARFVDEATGNVETTAIPEYPTPFFWGENGGIWKATGDELPPKYVYSDHLYIVKRMKDPELGNVVLLRHHTPMDGIQEFVVPNKVITEKNELRKVLSMNDVMCSQKHYDLIFEYLLIANDIIKKEKRTPLMRTQFGWADNDSKFIVGDKEITADGVFYSPPSSTTERIASHMTTEGTLEKWREVFNLYNTPGLEPHAFAALTAFGAPLLKFTGQSGAAINVIHSKSGTGKTTILHMCNSVWGNPRELCSTQSDTDNARILKLGVHNNLPYCVDEITNMHPLAFSDLIYAMSNGKGKDRMEASGNRLRNNTTKWQTISLCSSNASFYEKLTGAKAAPDGEMMRMIEYKIEQAGVLDVAKAKHLFDHQLMTNYGHAGPIYADWLVKNQEEARATTMSIQAKVDRELKLTQRERFWSAIVASNISGGLIATKYLHLMDWDMKRVYDYACNMVLSLRSDAAPPATDVEAVIGDYLNRHIGNTLVVNDEVDHRSKLRLAPVVEPKYELLVRYEPDTKRLYIAVNSFRDYCVKFQINYKETIDELKKQGVYLGAKTKRLGKGMPLNPPGVHALLLDTAAGGFLDVEEILPTEPETPDAGGGS